MYRTPAFVAALNPVYVYCDEAPIARLTNGSYAISEVVPGQHVLTSPVSRSPINLSLEAGQECFVWTGCTGLTNWAFEPVAKERAESEMKRLEQVHGG